jgi:hypothetical protein
MHICHLQLAGSFLASMWHASEIAFLNINLLMFCTNTSDQIIPKPINASANKRGDPKFYKIVSVFPLNILWILISLVSLLMQG